MSKFLIWSDLHLGHNAICKYRTQFSSPEEHHETIFDRLATALGKRDSLWLLGDIAFTQEWLDKIAGLKCAKKTLILGNHDLERKLRFTDLVGVYDSVQSLVGKRNYWFTHCPIHPDEIRGKGGVIHGHTHNKNIPDDRYFNACVENTDYHPITFEQIMERML